MTAQAPTRQSRALAVTFLLVATSLLAVALPAQAQVPVFEDAEACHSELDEAGAGALCEEDPTGLVIGDGEGNPLAVALCGAVHDGDQAAIDACVAAFEACLAGPDTGACVEFLALLGVDDPGAVPPECMPEGTSLPDVDNCLLVFGLEPGPAGKCDGNSLLLQSQDCRARIEEECGATLNTGLVDPEGTPDYQLCVVDGLLKYFVFAGDGGDTFAESVTIESDNVKDTSLARAGDTVLLAVTFTGEAFDVHVNFTVDGTTFVGGVDEEVGLVPDANGEGKSWTATLAVPDGLDGDVGFSIKYKESEDGEEQEQTETINDGGKSGVEVDNTAPSAAVSFCTVPTSTAECGDDGTRAPDGGALFVVVDGEVLRLEVTGLPEDIDGTDSADSKSTLSFGFRGATPTTEPITDDSDVTKNVAPTGNGEFLVDLVLEDLVGNTATVAGSVYVSVEGELVFATISEGGQSVNERVRHFADGDERTYEVTVVHLEAPAGTDPADAVGSILVQFGGDHNGNITLTSVSDPDAFVFFDGSGDLLGINVEFDTPLFEDTYTLTFSVESALLTDQAVGFDVTAYRTNLAAFDTVSAVTTLLGDQDGPDVGASAFPADNDPADGTLSFTEFQDAEGKILLDLSAIADNTGGSGVDSVRVWLEDGEGGFLFDETHAVGSDGMASFDIPPGALPFGMVTFKAQAVDVLGNEGPSVDIGLTVEIKQLIKVDPAGTVYVAPGGVSGVDFTITPQGVVDQFAFNRFELRNTTADYALAGYLDLNGTHETQVAKTFAGEVRFIRYSSPSHEEPFEVEAFIGGLEGAAHGDQSGFYLSVFDGDGGQDAYSIVDVAGDPFTDPVFLAVIDALGPDIVFDQIDEPKDGEAYPVDPSGTLTFNFTASDADSGLAHVALEESDGSGWTEVTGQTLDLGAGTIVIDRPDAGAYTYRLNATDAVGNNATTSDIGVTVQTAVSAALAVEIMQDGVPLTDDGEGLFYAALDSAGVGDVDDSDNVTFKATVLNETGDPLAGLDVTLAFGAASLTEVTDASGVATWSVDPDDHGLDFVTTVFTIEVPDQETQISGEDVAVNGEAHSVDMLWTGYYVDLTGSADEAAVGSSVDIDAAVFWLHDVIDVVTGDILVGAAVPVDTANFTDGTLSLVEDVGGQSTVTADQTGLGGTLGDPTPSFAGITRGAAISAGTPGDADAGYRNYTGSLAADLPSGGAGLYAADSHMVLFSGLRLRIDDVDQLGLVGGSAAVTLHAEWLHTEDYGGTAIDVDDIAGRDDIDLGGDAAGSILLNETNTVAVTGLAFPSGDGTFVFSGTWDEVFPVFDATAEAHGVVASLTTVPDDMTVDFGDPYTGAFKLVVDGVEVGDGFAGVSGSLDVSHAGEAAVANAYDGEAIGTPTDSFKVFLGGVEVPLASLLYIDAGSGDAWAFSISDPTAGEHALDVNLDVATMGGDTVTVTAGSLFQVNQTLYAVDVTGSDGAAVGDEVWVDMTDDVTLDFTVSLAEYNGTDTTPSGTAPDGVVVEAWVSDDDGANWTAVVGTHPLAANDGTGSITVENFADDSAGTRLVRLVVIDDGAGETFPATDGLNAATVEGTAGLVFTGLVVSFEATEDLETLVDNPLAVEVNVTYAHDGSPADGVGVTVGSATALVADEVVVTGADGIATATFTSAAALVVSDLQADVTGSVHGLAVPATETFGFDLRWSELTIDSIEFAESDDGTTFGASTGAMGNNYTATETPKYVKVILKVVLDAGDGSPTPVDGGTLDLGSSTVSIASDGTAERVYLRTSNGSTGQLSVDIVEATLDGETYGPIASADSFSVTWP